MVKISSYLFGAIPFFFTYALPATSSVITFDAVPSSGNPILTTLTTDGFTFTSGHFHTMDNATLPSFGEVIDNGTIYISEEAGNLGLPITMANSLGNPFSLVGIDGAETFLNDAAASAGGYPDASTLVLTGVPLGGGMLKYYICIRWY